MVGHFWGPRRARPRRQALRRRRRAQAADDRLQRAGRPRLHHARRGGPIVLEPPSILCGDAAPPALLGHLEAPAAPERSLGFLGGLAAELPASRLCGLHVCGLHVRGTTRDRASTRPTSSATRATAGRRHARALECPGLRWRCVRSARSTLTPCPLKHSRGDWVSSLEVASRVSVDRCLCCLCN